MEIDHKDYEGGYQKWYRFDSEEKHQIIQGLKSQKKLVEKKIKRIDNNPHNDGQATFTERKRELKYMLKWIDEIIVELTPQGK
jgi:ATPase subunit of ABC transporter with duplicated ATPase domains